MLTKALESLKEILVPDEYQVSCLVSDNDPEKSAEEVFDQVKVEFPFPIEYFFEAKPGIVPNRNRLLDEATKLKADYLAFFDDDETVDKNWLIELLKASKKFGAEAVWGRTIYSLPKNHPDWLSNRNFYGGDQPETGTNRRGASTNNVLIDMNFLNSHSLRFSMEFNDIGGSDSFLFREFWDKGGKVISSQEAITYEEVPESRATEDWILRRAYKNAHTEYKRARLRKGMLAAFALVVFYGLWLSLNYSFAHFRYPFSTYDFKVFNRRRKAKVRGLLDALNGHTHKEYEVVHGG